MYIFLVLVGGGGGGRLLSEFYGSCNDVSIFVDSKVLQIGIYMNI